MMLASRSVTICERDSARILALLDRTRTPALDLLFEEIDAANVVPDSELPDDVVAMGSTVTFRNLHSDEQLTIRLVYPDQADADSSHVSILAPVGAALIGLEVGECIEWPLPNGKSMTMRVESVRNDDDRGLP